MKKKIGYFWLRAVCFTLILAVVLLYGAYVLTPKNDYGICSMLTYYGQEENTIDVLAVGTSMVYAGINTNVLWAEYGIAAYDLCSAEQPYWISYYMIKEALKTQHPKVLLLDAKPATYTADWSKRGRVILSAYGMLGPGNRFGAIMNAVESVRDAWDFILMYPQIHNNYSTLTLDDFVLPPDNGGRGSSWKGYIEADEVDQHERPSMVWTSTTRNLNAREEEYVRKIFELCADEGVEVLLVGMPNPDYENDHMYYNALWKVAEEYGVEGINYNDPSLRYGLRYSSDFADWQHLNVKGSITLSKKLGEDLRERYDLADHRGDAAYASYDECLATWLESAPEFESSGDTWQDLMTTEGETADE